MCIPGRRISYISYQILRNLTKSYKNIVKVAHLASSYENLAGSYSISLEDLTLKSTFTISHRIVRNRTKIVQVRTLGFFDLGTCHSSLDDWFNLTIDRCICPFPFITVSCYNASGPLSDEFQINSASSRYGVKYGNFEDHWWTAVSLVRDTIFQLNSLFSLSESRVVGKTEYFSFSSKAFPRPACNFEQFLVGRHRMLAVSCFFLRCSPSLASVEEWQMQRTISVSRAD